VIGKIIRRSPKSRSSFKRVVSYVSDRAMTDGRAESLGHAAEYITRVGKARHVHLRHLVSLETASTEMRATAGQAPRAGNPVMHIVLSWPEGELPSPGQAWEAGAHVLETLGLGEHQAVMAVHQDTHHRHLHIVCCRVHPQTCRPHYPAWAHRELAHACREVELKQGWTHEPGLYEAIEVNGDTVIVPRRRHSREASAANARPLSAAARDMETWSDADSFLRYVSRVGPTVRAVLRRRCSWAALHNALAEHSLRWEPYGTRGAVIVDRDHPDHYHCAASRLGSWARRSRLEQRLGPYEPPGEKSHASAPQRRYRQARRPRDPGRRVARSAAREALRQRYREYVARVHAKNDRIRADKRAAWTAQKARERQRWEDFLRQSRERRDDLLRYAHSPAQRRVARSLAAWERARRKATLDAQREQDRQRLRRDYDGRTRPVLPWRRWVYTQYIGGDAEAARAWRGLVYRNTGSERDPRRSELKEALGMIVASNNRVNVRSSDDGGAASDIMDLHANPARDGSVIYVRPNHEVAFVDQGRRVLVHDTAPDSVEAAVLFAAERFGGVITIHGSHTFRQEAYAMAHRHGIRVTNPPAGERASRPKRRQSLPTGPRGNDHDELAAFKHIDMVQFACDRYGFQVDSRESTRQSIKLRRGGDILVVRRDGRGEYGFFGASSGDPHDNGDIIALVQREEHVSIGEVRKILRPYAGATSPSPSRRPERKAADRASEAARVHRRWSCAARGEHADWGYAEARGLSRALLARLHGDVRVDRCGNLLCAHRDERGNMVGFEIKGKSFAGFSKGGQKRLFAVGATHPNRIAILESGLDALSMMQYEQRQDTLYVSVGGAFGRSAVEQLRLLAERHPRAEVAIAVDNDAVGDCYTAQLREALPQERITDARPPSPGTDWNDVLIAHYHGHTPPPCAPSDRLSR